MTEVGEARNRGLNILFKAASYSTELKINNRASKHWEEEEWGRGNFKYCCILIFYFGVSVDRYKIDKPRTRGINI